MFPFQENYGLEFQWNYCHWSEFCRKIQHSQWLANPHLFCHHILNFLLDTENRNCEINHKLKTVTHYFARFSVFTGKKLSLFGQIWPFLCDNRKSNMSLVWYGLHNKKSFTKTIFTSRQLQAYEELKNVLKMVKIT